MLVKSWKPYNRTHDEHFRRTMLPTLYTGGLSYPNINWGLPPSLRPRSDE
jgi:hypothetical protein